MSLMPNIADRISLPAICAPMFLVSTVKLVTEAAKAGIMAALPRGNFRSTEEFEGALQEIARQLAAHRDAAPGAMVGPVAVNLPTSLPADELAMLLGICAKHGVQHFIAATGDPTEFIRRVHDFGGQVLCDAISIRFAEKAIAAGADGITAICSGGGGHSGSISAMALIPRIREMFDGTLVLGGAISSGAAIRAAEVLGADLAYIGTRFIATQEAGAGEAYKQLLLSQSAKDIVYSPSVTGVHASWLVESLRLAGLDPSDMPAPKGKMRYDHLPDDVRPWRDLWSAGQGVELIRDIPTVAELVDRLRAEYVAAARAPSAFLPPR
ncbi:MAG: nitronate monooxygenase [Sphingomonadales bacterium]|nr:MAG: nitronate monooxygenase [Sphingomonadales bacterium]